MSAGKILSGMTEAIHLASQAARVARIIQAGREEGASATSVAYRILDALGHCTHRESSRRRRT